MNKLGEIIKPFPGKGGFKSISDVEADVEYKIWLRPELDLTRAFLPAETGRGSSKRPPPLNKGMLCCHLPRSCSSRLPCIPLSWRSGDLASLFPAQVWQFHSDRWWENKTRVLDRFRRFIYFCSTIYTYINARTIRYISSFQVKCVFKNFCTYFDFMKIISIYFETN